MRRSWLCRWDLAIVLILLSLLLSRLHSRHRSGLQKRTGPLPAPDERLFGPPQPRGLRSRTRRFEPAAYRAYYPEDSAGRPDAELREHYQAVGRREHRVPRRLRVVLRYLAKAGLTNQHFCHVHFVAAALQAGAEVVLADAWYRGSTFGQRYWDNPWPKGWTAVPVTTLYDVDPLIAWAADNAAVVHVAAPNLPDGTTAGTGVRKACCLMPLADFVTGLREDAVTAAEGFLRSHPGEEAEPPTVVVDVEDSSYSSIETGRSPIELLSTVNDHLAPARHLAHLADAIVAGIKAENGVPQPFNGVHLRVEGDADYQSKLGGLEAAWEMYHAAMEGAGFDSATPLYVASGLLTYLNQSEFADQVSRRLTDRNQCSDVVYKELFLSKDQLAGLHTEALAMVDKLVLERAQAFVGLQASSFGWYVWGSRCQRGSPDNTTHWAGPLEPRLARSAIVHNHTATCPS